MKKIIPFLLASIIFFSCSKDDGGLLNNGLAYKEIMNEKYGSDSLQKFDIYLPAGRATAITRVIIMIHGGAWTSGDKTDMESNVPLIKAKDASWAVVNMNYRLVNGVNNRFPAQMTDIQMLIDTLEARRSQYNISSKLAILGVSAGAHLGMLYTYGYDTPKKIKAMGDVVGPTDLTDTAYLNNPLFVPAAAALLGYTYAQNPALYAQVSPALQANATSAPTAMFYGGVDPLVPNSQHLTLKAKLTTLGVPFIYTFYPTEGHGWTGANLDDTINKMMAFFNQYVQ